MNLASIDAEITRLQTLRSHVSAASEDGKRRVAEAQKARWAKQKKAAKTAGETPAKKIVAKKRAVKKAAAKRPLQLKQPNRRRRYSSPKV